MKSESKSRMITRRDFLHRTAVAASAVASVPSLKTLGYRSPNEKLNLAVIGAGGQPFSDLRVAHGGVENVVAMCDVDWKRGARGFETFPGASKYKDFRQMLDKSAAGSSRRTGRLQPGQSARHINSHARRQERGPEPYQGRIGRAGGCLV